MAGKSINTIKKGYQYAKNSIGTRRLIPKATSTGARNEGGPAHINESGNDATNAAAAQLEEAKLKAVANAAAKAKDSAAALVDALPLVQVDVPPEVVDMYSKALSSAIDTELNEKKKI